MGSIRETSESRRLDAGGLARGSCQSEATYEGGKEADGTTTRKPPTEGERLDTGHSMIIAYHGFGGTAQMLREDIGSIELDIHFSDARNVRAARREIERMEASSLSAIGYSRGCRIIADLTCLMPEVFQRVVLYEGPLGRMRAAGGNAPALIIWNDLGRGHMVAAEEMEIAWNRGGRHVQHLQGIGGHVRKDPELGLRHAWDQKLNRKIVKFLEG